jgi:diguanylate cyclase (GGDEF)-like protein
MKQAAFRRIVISTVMSVVLSAFMASLATSYVFGTQPGALVPVWEVFTFGLFVSVLLPALICPIVSYKMALTGQERDEANARLRQLAETDHLTGLLNRRGFDAAAQMAISNESIGEIAVSAMMIDIDFFKKVNDRFGHEFGDAALVHIARILQDMASSEGFIVGRQGGEEFVALLPGRTEHEALSIAERFRHACSEAPVDCKGQSASIAVSIGVSSQSLPVLLSQLLGKADDALYRAKQDGRNRVILNCSAVARRRVA